MLKPEIPGFTLCRRGPENAFSAEVVCLTRIYTSGTERRSDPSLVAEKSKLEQRIESIQDQKATSISPQGSQNVKHTATLFAILPTILRRSTGCNFVLF